MTSTQLSSAGRIGSSRAHRSIAVAACLFLLLVHAPGVRAQGGWSAMLSVQPFPPAYPSAWEFDPNVASLTVTAPPGTNPRYRIVLTISMNGSVVMTGSSLERTLAPSTLSDIVYAPDLIDWPSARYSSSVQSFIDQTERFPEGNYTLRTRVEAASNGQALAEATAEFMITYPDPPSVLFPPCGSSVDNDFPVFQWTPVQVPVQYPVHYVFRVVEVLDGQIPETALRNNEVRYEDLDVTGLSLQYPLSAEPLEPGKTYAWQVQVLDDAGQSPATNNGLSEVCTFSVPDRLSTEPPLVTDAAISLVRTLPSAPFAGSSLDGLEDKPFNEVLRRLEELVSDTKTKQISLPLPSPRAFDTIALPNAEISIDSLLGSFAIGAQIELLGQTVDVVFAGLNSAGAASPDGGGDTGSDAGTPSGGGSFVFGARPPSFRFGDLVEPLRGTVLDDLDLGGNLISLSSASFRLDPNALPPIGADLFGSIPLDLTPGINFDHTVEIPGNAERLKRPCEVLGIDEAEVELSGHIDISLDDLRSGNAITDAVDLSLSAKFTGTDPPWFPNWLHAGVRTITFEMDSTLQVIATAELEATLDGSARSLEASVDASDLGDSGPVVLRAAMQDTWHSPFGVEWLDLDDVAVELTMTDTDSADVAISGSFGVGNKRCDARIEVTGVGENQTARFTGSVDALSLAEAMDLAARAGLPVPDQIPGDALALEDVVLSFESSDANSFAISANTRVFDVPGSFLVAATTPENADPELLIGVRVPEFGLHQLHPALEGTPVGGLTIPEVAFTQVVTLSGGIGGGGEGGETGTGESGESGSGSDSGGVGISISIPSIDLSLPALKFFRPVFGAGGGGSTGGESGEVDGGTDNGEGGGGGAFTLDLLPGLNLDGTLPLSPLGPDLLKALGIENPDLGVHLSGSLGTNFGALAAGDLSNVIGWHLSAKLPSREMANLPDWLSVAGGGGRSLDISMDPDLAVSVTDVLAAELDGKTRLFRFGADLAVQDTTASATLRGQLVEPWKDPYGLTWLDLTDVEIELSTDTEGNAGATLFGGFDVGSKHLSATIEILTTDAGEAARFTGTVDELGLNDVFEFARKMGLQTPDLSGEDPFTLHDVAVSFESSDANTFAVSATATVFDAEGDFLVSIAKRDNANPELLLGVRIPEFALADLAPPLGNTMVGDLTMPDVAFTIVQELGGGGSGGGGTTAGGEETTEENGGTSSQPKTISFPSVNLSPAAIQFFRPVYGRRSGGGGSGGEAGGGGSSGGAGEDFTLVMSPGLNLGGRLPLAPLGPQLLKVLGFSGDSPEVLLEGSLGVEIGLLSGNGLAELKSWRLHAELPSRDRENLPDWLELDPNTQRTFDIGMDPDGVEVSITDVMKANLDGKRRTFVFSRSLATQDSSAAMTMRGEMQGGWKHPYGIKWMNLDQVAIELTGGTEGVGARLESTTQLAGKTFDVSIELEGSKNEMTATFTGSVDKLSAGEFVELLTEQLELDGPVFDWSPPDKLLDLEKPTVTIVVGTEMAFSVSAATTLFDQSADLQFFARKEKGQKAQFLLAVRPQEMSLSGLLPDLNSPVLEGLKLPKGALVVSKSERRIESKELTDDTRGFYREIYGMDDFSLDIAPGLNLVAPLPLGNLDDNSPLRKALELISPNAPMDRLVIEGTLPGAILGLGGDSGLSGLSLKANLPAIKPKADWLEEAQLAIAITGRPSVGFAGHLTVKVDDDLLTFLTEVNIAVVPAGVELGLLGALEAEEPWVAPLGIKWLTFNEVRLKTAINPVSVKLGFLGRIKIGEKDIEVIAMLPVNLYTGVPTGIGLKGASEEGVALSDIADLQNAMAQAAGRSQPRLPVDELPDIAVKDLDFRFSTLEDPDLDLHLGMTVGGQLWVELEPGQMEDFAGILFDVGLDGILGQAHLDDVPLGPMEWKDALLDIAVTLPDRHMIIEGGLDLGFAAGQGKMTMAKRKMALDANMKIMNRFGCRVTANGEMALGASNLTVQGEMKNDFNGAIAGEIVSALQGITEVSGDLLGPAQKRVDDAQALYAQKEAALAVARKEIEKMKADIAQARDLAQSQIAPRERAKNQAKAARYHALGVWQKTPLRQRSLRKSRRQDYYRKRDAHVRARNQYITAVASYEAADKAYKALKPVEEYKVVQAALKAADAASVALDAAQRDLEKAREAATALINSIEPGSVSVERASFTGKLARAKQGGGVEMSMTVRVKNTRKNLKLQWNFVSLKDIAKAAAREIIAEITKS